MQLQGFPTSVGDVHPSALKTPKLNLKPGSKLKSYTCLKSVELILQDSTSPLDRNAASLYASLYVVLVFAETFIAALVILFL